MSSYVSCDGNDYVSGSCHGCHRMLVVMVMTTYQGVVMVVSSYVSCDGNDYVSGSCHGCHCMLVVMVMTTYQGVVMVVIVC